MIFQWCAFSRQVLGLLGENDALLVQACFAGLREQLTWMERFRRPIGALLLSGCLELWVQAVACLLCIPPLLRRLEVFVQLCDFVEMCISAEDSAMMFVVVIKVQVVNLSLTWILFGVILLLLGLRDNA